MEQESKDELLQSEEAVIEQTKCNRIGKKSRFIKKLLFLPILFFVVSILEYISIECFLSGSLKEIGVYYGFKNVMLILSVNLLLLSFFHRMRPALLVSECLALALGTANYFVDAFRGYGIVYMDLFAVKTAANVAGDYNYSIDTYFLAGIAAGIVGIGLSLLAPARKKGHRYWNRKSVAAGIAGMLVCGGFYLWLGNTYTYWEDVSGLTWDHNIGISEYGYILYVTANAGDASVEPPEGYSPEKVDEILSRYGKTSGVNSVLADRSGGITSPNLIMIMNESFSDLNVLGDVKTDKPYLEFFNRLKKNTIRGYVESSVYGGYTANSEFEFLTGCTKAFFPGNPYLQYLDDYLPTIITNIKAQGNYEEAVAFHPYNPSGYNRNRVYPLLGFDSFLSIDDVKNPLLVRKYVSDQTNYEFVENLYEQKEKDTSFLMFNVTMQNHSAYSDTSYQFEDRVRMISKHGQFEAEQYMSLIKMSDAALEELIAYFKKVKEPTLIVMFGDHQPHLPDYFYEEVMEKNPDQFDQEETMKKYQVPFLIWANYDIQDETIENTSLNYLSGIMMQAAGLELTDYQRFLMQVYRRFPSISANGYYDAKGTLHSWEETDVEHGELLKEYEMIQYNYLFDKENFQEEHFRQGVK